MKFNIIKSNIVDVVADAIVLPANEKLKEGSGASTALFEAAGRKKLTKACMEIGHCDIGSAVPTLAFNLKARFLIHAVVPVWIDGNHNEYELLSSAYLSALNLADVMECTSIAFPLLASGHNKFDKELAVKIAHESIERFEGTNLKKVTIVIYGDSTEKLMKNLGYAVAIIPKRIHEEEQKALKKAKREKLLAEGKEVVQQFLEEQMKKGIEWLKAEENKEKVLKLGMFVVKTVF